jgi:hypothetical protein
MREAADCRHRAPGPRAPFELVVPLLAVHIDFLYRKLANTRNIHDESI